LIFHAPTLITQYMEWYRGRSRNRDFATSWFSSEKLALHRKTRKATYYRCDVTRKCLLFRDKRKANYPGIVLLPTLINTSCRRKIPVLRAKYERPVGRLRHFLSWVSRWLTLIVGYTGKILG